MECTGKLIGLSKDWITGKWQVTFSINEEYLLNAINELKDSLLSIKAVKYKKKRSLDANAYYWQLLSKVAEALGNSKAYQHNWMLRRYGQYEMFGEQCCYVVLPDTEEAEKQIDEAETYHLKPTSQVKEGKDGVMYRTYMMLKGSSDFDTKEMSILIDGVVSKAKELDIETLPPEELERMVSLWKR